MNIQDQGTADPPRQKDSRDKTKDSIKDTNLTDKHSQSTSHSRSLSDSSVSPAPILRPQAFLPTSSSSTRPGNHHQHRNLVQQQQQQQQYSVPTPPPRRERSETIPRRRSVANRIGTLLGRKDSTKAGPMAMATPAPLPTPASPSSPSRTNGSFSNRNGSINGKSQGNGNSSRHGGADLDRSPLPTFNASSSSTTAHHRPHQFVQNRTLKSSKSVDGLMGRARSHTADPTIHNPRGNFQHLHINSPNLTQTQLDTYGVPDDQQQRPSVPLRRGVSVSHNGNEHSPSSSSSSREETLRTPRRPSQRQQQRQQDQSRERSSSRHRDQQPMSPIQPTPISSSSSQSPYQNLNVQSSQIASRSTPKLSLYPQQQQHPIPPSQRDFTSDSKETRSFNGLPGQLESTKPKPKTSKLKPIVTPEKTNDDHVERDQYGFKKESQWLSHRDFVIFETQYIPIMERRRQKWAIFMNDSHGELPPRSAKLKRYIRKGIPPALRGEAWFHYSGAEDKFNANPGLFKRLLAQAKMKGSANEYAEVIERDLHRTFPENINFKSQITQQQDGGTQLSTDNVAAIQSLRRVLLAFSLHCPSIGYCQSLNYIAGLLLLFMNEEQSFWTLSVIIQNFLPEGMYDVTMEGANLDQAVLMTLIMERLPTVWAKFSGGATSVEMDEGPGLPTVTLVTSHWFLTLFINILPVESILRVWDCFFYEGRKILFRVALTILRLHEAEIAKIDDPLEVFQVVQNIPKRLIDCHKLMEACFKRMGSFDLTTKDIDRRYDQFRAKRRNARAAAQASRSTAAAVKK
ncbi:hypothetical protein BGZ83_008277 [Gryganskiella cystojenkinii]|nr:hypothetical protein BGZ83_008277 [Gryganskiella cystojenkinii]